MKIIKRFIYNFLDYMLKQDKNFLLVSLAKKHVDRFLYQNNTEMDKNGELFFLNCFSKVLSSGIIFDIGANKGNWTRKILEMNNNYIIHCFEPSKECFEDLHKADLPYNKVFLHNLALSNQVGEAELYNFSSESELSSLHLRKTVVNSLNLEVSSTYKINLETVDNICKSHNINEISLLKIDTEGNEKNVLEGSIELLKSNKIKIIQFEYGGTWIDSRTFLVDTWQLLENFGYKIYKIAPNGLIFYNKYNPVLENFQYSNFVAISPDINWSDNYIYKRF
ncbi:MAG: FkbM family methyltransferase [uncultured bacterium]|nr:MAG: FkbM family methyltransferase [uncultured bacterium]